MWKARVLPMTAKASRTESMTILTVELYSPSFTRAVVFVVDMATVMVVSFTMVELLVVVKAIAMVGLVTMVELVVASAIVMIESLTMVVLLVKVVTAIA